MKMMPQAQELHKKTKKLFILGVFAERERENEKSPKYAHIYAQGPSEPLIIIPSHHLLVHLRKIKRVPSFPSSREKKNKGGQPSGTVHRRFAHKGTLRRPLPSLSLGGRGMERYIVDKHDAAPAATPVTNNTSPSRQPSAAAAPSSPTMTSGPPSPAPRAFVQTSLQSSRKKEEEEGSSSSSSPRRMGLLARYSRWSHERPWTGFGLVVASVLLITVIVGVANLANFYTDESDKVRVRASVGLACENDCFSIFHHKNGI